VHSADHVQTAPDDSSSTPQLTRRDLRAAEERARNRRREPRTRPAARTATPAPRPLRQRVAAGVAMSFIALFAVSASLPALAVDSEMGFTSGTVPSPGEEHSFTSASVDRDEVQSVTVSATAATQIVRDGYTVTDIPEPEPVTSSASSGDFASIDVAGSWVLPAVGFISSPFGPRPNRPVAGVNAFHSGTDIASSCGQGIYAATDGTVIRSGYQGSYGNWVLIDHGNGVETGYAHNSSVEVSRGQSVAAGERIASMGSTGASTGCHLHFETRIDGERVNPERFMSARGVTLG